MRINTLRTRAGLLILLAMGLTGAAWRSGAMPGRRWRRCPAMALCKRSGGGSWRCASLTVKEPGSASTSSRSRP